MGPPASAGSSLAGGGGGPTSTWGKSPSWRRSATLSTLSKAALGVEPAPGLFGVDGRCLELGDLVVGLDHAGGLGPLDQLGGLGCGGGYAVADGLGPGC
jgi:hypothetical protein